ncbi:MULTISPECIES: DMT family transporter [Colwellia]|uniref:Membrane protein n=1 Tax=Colwellia psychrerythraea (strain 34H / ATCC BAA-681) TaxID=167879 RepID=Q480G7_COLP3|nr:MULTISPECIES: DMT family transporter [Colwellia]AAZ25698.1 membrane protein [Colwellia psychrerythraea 34H]PKH87405.1 EamA/RhaT family transporter [Colwellia sp. Bg11-28]
MEIWIYFTLLAATMQAVRTAGQKQLSGKLNSMATTGVRYVFALPFAWAYLWWMLDFRQVAVPALNNDFLQYALIACVMQIVGTVCLVAAFRYRNFAVATSLAKTEAIQVAIVGALVFGATLSGLGWFSVIVGVVGVFLVSKVRFNLRDILADSQGLIGMGYGLAAGLGLAITTLLIRESSLALNTDLMVSAAVTLVFMITVQSVISLIYVYIQDKSQLPLMMKHWRLCLFVGVTSVLGSIGWFTGASYQNAAYVKALGQVEFFITLALTYRVFKETVTLKEYLGMFLIVLSVVILLLWS